MHESIHVLHPVIAPLGTVLGLYLPDVGQPFHHVVSLHILADRLNAAVPCIEGGVVANVRATAVVAIAPEPIPCISCRGDRGLVALADGKTGLGAGNCHDQTGINRILLAVGFKNWAPPRQWRWRFGAGLAREILINGIVPSFGNRRW